MLNNSVTLCYKEDEGKKMAYLNATQICKEVGSSMEEFNDFLKDKPKDYLDKNIKNKMFYSRDLIEDFKDFHDDYKMREDILFSIMRKRLY